MVGLCCNRSSRSTTPINEDVKVVQELLRHANSRITLDLYAQAGMAGKREAGLGRVLRGLLVHSRQMGLFLHNGAIFLDANSEPLVVAHLNHLIYAFLQTHSFWRSRLPV